MKRGFPVEQYLTLSIFTLFLAAGEEIGWRGFAIPRMLERFPPLGTAILFGILHAAFHLPIFLLPIPPELRQASPYWLFNILLLGYSIPGVWLYNRTRGSVPVAIIYHWAMNMSVLLVNGAPREMIAWLLPVAWIITAVITLTVVGFQLQHDRMQADEPVMETAATT